MTFQEFITIITEKLSHEPTADQQAAMLVFARFLASQASRPVMILRGSAGTGKTSLAAAMVRTLYGLHQRIVLLAPTGRAAKVFSMTSGLPAHTIHRRIYRERRHDGPVGEFCLDKRGAPNTLYVVDEASMISTDTPGSHSFGSGSLLDDLIAYVYQTDHCKLMFIGDAAQLPPVGESCSPALMTNVLEQYGLTVYEATLNDVVRQEQMSGILVNATALRKAAVHDVATVLPTIYIKGMPDVVRVSGAEIIDYLESSYAQMGMDGTIVITRSNKQANIYNQGIRAKVLGMEEALCRGDRLMVVRNNYHWTEQVREAQPEAPMPIRFLANGDIAKVRRFHHRREAYGFEFADATLSFPDYDAYEMDVTILLDTLTSESSALTGEQSNALYSRVMEDYADLRRKRERVKAIRQDAHANALQVKFAYAVTCHKAQGGQWEHVYLDQGYMTEDMLSQEYIRWLYTAFTRATQKLFLVNWPDNQCDL